MKKINAAAIVTSLLLVGGNVFAESEPLTNESIQGTWNFKVSFKLLIFINLMG